MTVEVAAVDPYAITQMGIQGDSAAGGVPFAEVQPGRASGGAEGEAGEGFGRGKLLGDVLLASRGKVGVLRRLMGWLISRRRRLTRSILGFGLGR